MHNDYRESCRDYFDKLCATVVSVEFIRFPKLNGFIVASNDLEEIFQILSCMLKIIL